MQGFDSSNYLFFDVSAFIGLENFNVEAYVTSQIIPVLNAQWANLSWAFLRVQKRDCILFGANRKNIQVAIVESAFIHFTFERLLHNQLRAVNDIP